MSREFSGLLLFSRFLFLLMILGTFVSPVPGADSSSLADTPPNVVIVFADDLGYADIGCFGAKKYKTPHIDRIAAEGVRFTHFYVAQAVCSASRTALLTGCYPNRVGILGALGPKDRHGINAEEIILSELLKSRGYATGCFGKWHLGHHSQFLPTQNGFDEYFGLPYSNDMWPLHPESPKAFPPLPLIDMEKPIETNPDQALLTTRYTEKAVRFIEKNKDRPFFVYLPHSMPHVPLFVSEKHRGKTERGLYGDVIEEIDWSVGQVLDTLDRLNLSRRTLVIFTSDNGPWLSYGDHAGSTGGLREGKGTSFEGGVRVPCVMRFPGSVPAGTVCAEPAMTIDLFPTIAQIAGAKLPADRIIDGRDIAPLMFGKPGTKSPHEALLFYWGAHLQGIRSGKWKLHFPHDYRTLEGRPGGNRGVPAKYATGNIGLALYDLDRDPNETTDRSEDYPEVVARLQGLADKARKDLGDSATKTRGINLRPPGKIPDEPRQKK